MSHDVFIHISGGLGHVFRSSQSPTADISLYVLSERHNNCKMCCILIILTRWLYGGAILHSHLLLWLFLLCSDTFVMCAMVTTTVLHFPKLEINDPVSC